MTTMNTENKQPSSVYKITGFSDIVASPVFYSILFLALVLGLSSVFGFLQNPRKLKTVIDVIHQKVSVSANENSASRNIYSLIQPSKERNQDFFQADTRHPVTISYLEQNRYSIFSKNISLADSSKKGGQSTVSFDYDITSKHFWGTFNDYEIAPLSEEGDYKSNHLLRTIPVDEIESTEFNNEKYSLTKPLTDPKTILISL